MAKIALTFNDDPKILRDGGIPLGTAELLRVAAELSAAWSEPLRFTFFVVGENLQQMQAQQPDLIAQMVKGGHEIANHSFSKPKNFHQLSPSAALDEVRRTHNLILQHFGVAPRYFRPPNGLISPEIEAAIRQEFPNYQIVGWDRHDEKGNDTPADFCDRVLRQAYDQQVPMMHAWRKSTLWAIRGILTGLRSQGYRFVPLSELERRPPRLGLRDYAPPKAGARRIAMTFDDDPKVLTQDGVKLGTAELLRVIEELNRQSDNRIYVTFFAVGVNLEKARQQYPDVIERIRAGRHEVQNHSYSHPSNFHQLSPTQAVDEVRRNHDLITELFGREPRFFRPPKGLISPVNHQAILKAFPSYQICGWDRHDEKDFYTPDQLRQVVVRNAWDQQIVLLHVWYKNTMWAVRGILSDLQRQNYQFVNLSDLERETAPLYGLSDKDHTMVA
ncbi:MAG TPA: polysaccharide deacetylase family protein [Trichocoleus sp.]